MNTQNEMIYPGNPETDFFYYHTPEEFHNLRAFRLFEAAERAGLLCWAVTNQAAVDFGEDPEFALLPDPSGPLKTQTHLAYWSAKASFYLGLDRGTTTNWKPFEELFGKDSKTFSRAAGPLDLDRLPDTNEPTSNSNYATAVNDFFSNLENAQNDEQQ